jgi:uncharacterized damage-inducible protein DinB
MTSPSVKEAWQANTRVNTALLEHLTPEMLDAHTPGVGYSVAQHLAHMTQVTKYWGSLRDAGFADLPDLYFDYNPETQDFKAETDLGKVQAAMTQTWAQALEAPDVAEPSGESVEPPHPTTDAYLLHMMVHDAHHRGQILLALKTAGHPLPDEDLMWGPWRGEGDRA